MQNYKKNSRDRIKKQILSFLSLAQFKTAHLSLYGKMALVSMCVAVMSLFITWGHESQRDITWNAFSHMSGHIGYIMLILILCGIGTLLSQNHKQKIKFSTSIAYSDHLIIIGIGICMCVASLISLSFLSGLSLYSTGIISGSGIPLGFSSGTLIIISGWCMARAYKKHPMGTMMNESKEEREK